MGTVTMATNKSLLVRRDPSRGLRQMLTRFAHLLARDGPLDFLLSFGYYLRLQVACRENYHVMQHHLTDVGACAPPAANMICRLVRHPDDIDRLIRTGYRVGYLDTEYVRNALLNDNVLFCVFVDDEVAHNTWVAIGPRSALDFFTPCVNYQQAGYITDCYTRPQYRGRRIYPYALAEACKWLRDSGFQRACLVVQENNAPSIAAISHAGFEFCGRVRFKRVLFRSQAEVKGTVEGIWRTDRTDTVEPRALAAKGS
jgi:ribosomal protein S18 acetylase RimI-like enzyme